jgi:hypothetical protein
MRRNWRTSAIAAVGVVALFTSLTRAQAPATQPSADRYDTLIQQLGDEDFKVRDQASAQLAKAGADARPALVKASSSDDPEVRWRAEDLLKQLDAPPQPADDAQQQAILDGPVGGQVIIINGGRVIINGGQFAPADIVDDLDKLRTDLEARMGQLNMGESQRQLVRGLLNKINLARLDVPERTDPRFAQQEDAYLQDCDDLRKLLASLKLPDPGAALPPPKGSRLGVQVGITSLEQGVLITDVDPGSRGEKLGLKGGDVIVSVNGQAMNSIHELRDTVTVQTHLVVSIVRNGEQMTLREPAPAANQ